MPIEQHIDKLVDAYTDGTLSPQAYRRVQLHIRKCPACARLLFDTQQLEKQLKPTMRAALGHPSPRPMLRHKVKAALQQEQQHSRSFFNWAVPVQFFNAVGTVAVIALLAFGVFMVVQGRAPGILPVSGFTGSGAPDTTGLTPTFTPVALVDSQTGEQPKISSLGDTLVLSSSMQPNSNSNQPTQVAGLAETTDPLEANPKIDTALSTKPQPEGPPSLGPISGPKLPTGTIAVGLFSQTLDTYEIHFITPDSGNHRQFPLAGISEPALHPTNNKYPLAFRAWSEPTSPRSLFTSDLTGERPESVTDFWEDAQPDWSPIENRIIFASQRESDRRWRLYTAWGDGSLEVNLRREGKSPTFAPDGYRFAFESCNDSGNQCGLWVSNLEHSEFEAQPILVDPQAKSPDWSPLGEEIAYMANANNNWDLYLVNSDGSNVRRLTDNPANDGLPVWSPDGKWLAFVSDRSGQWSVWLLHVSSGKLHQSITFSQDLSLASPNRPPYNEHNQRYWWDEQLSWGP